LPAPSVWPTLSDRRRSVALVDLFLCQVAREMEKLRELVDREQGAAVGPVRRSRP
jgi:hypothetical protein